MISQPTHTSGFSQCYNYRNKDVNIHFLYVLLKKYGLVTHGKGLGKPLFMTSGLLPNPGKKRLEVDTLPNVCILANSSN